MTSELHATIRHALTVLGVVFVASVALFFVLHRIAPPPTPVHSPVAVFTPSPLQHEVNALKASFDAFAAAHAASPPIYMQPAISVAQKTPACHGLTAEQCGLIMGALKPKTVEKIAVSSVLAAPTPAPTPSDATYQQVYAADYAATTHALKDTKINTNVTITREEVAPSRIGSMIASGGTGISYAALRRRQYEFDLGLLQPNSGAHLIGAAALIYNIPHTSLGLGPSITYQHGLKYGISAVVHF